MTTWVLLVTIWLNGVAHTDAVGTFDTLAACREEGARFVYELVVEAGSGSALCVESEGGDA